MLFTPWKSSPWSEVSWICRCAVNGYSMPACICICVMGACMYSCMYVHAWLSIKHVCILINRSYLCVCEYMCFVCFYSCRVCACQCVCVIIALCVHVCLAPAGKVRISYLWRPPLMHSSGWLISVPCSQLGNVWTPKLLTSSALHPSALFPAALHPWEPGQVCLISPRMGLQCRARAGAVPGSPGMLSTLWGSWAWRGTWLISDSSHLVSVNVQCPPRAGGIHLIANVFLVPHLKDFKR